MTAQTAVMTNGFDFIENLKALVAQSGRSASAISKAAGLGTTFIRDIYRGTVRSPRGESLEKLARELGTSVDALLGNQHQEPVYKGLSEDLQPWQPKPELGDQESLAKSICPNAKHPIFMRVSRNFPGLSILTGDLIIYDMNTAPQKGDAVIINCLDAESGTANTTIKIFADPYLINANGQYQSEVALADGNLNAVMGPVIGIIRSNAI